MDPVANVQTIAVKGHLLAVEQVRHKQWNDFFGKLERTKVVRGSRDDDWQSVGLLIRKRDQIGAGLRR